jgi:hypothetical protein
MRCIAHAGDLAAARRRNGCIRSLGITSVVALIALVSVVGAADAAVPTAGRTKTSVWFQTRPGPDRRVVTMPQPRGIVLLTRLTTTYGIRASAAATIPGVAGVRVVNYGQLGVPSPCRRRGAVEVCTQSQEGCPMPRAVWRIHLLKTGGPAGLVRFDFVVGKPPAK